MLCAKEAHQGVLGALVLVFVVTVLCDLVHADTNSLFERASGPELSHSEKRARPLLHKLRAYSVVHIGSEGAFPMYTQALEPEVPQPHVRRLKFSFDDKNFHIRLVKNTELFAPSYREVAYLYNHGESERLNPDDEGIPMTDGRNCFYHGVHVDSDVDDVEMRGDEVPVKQDGEVNYAAMHTCYGGFSGMIQAHGGAYVVEPAHEHLSPKQHVMHTQRLQEEHGVSKVHAHIVFKAEDLDEEGACGVTHVHEEMDEYDYHEDGGLKQRLRRQGASSRRLTDSDDLSSALNQPHKLRLDTLLREMTSRTKDDLHNHDDDDDGNNDNHHHHAAVHRAFLQKHARLQARNARRHGVDRRFLAVEGEEDAALTLSSESGEEEEEKTRHHMQTQATTNTIEFLVANDIARIKRAGNDGNGVPKVWVDSAAVVNKMAAIYKNSNFNPIIDLKFVHQISFLSGDPFTIPVGKTAGISKAECVPLNCPASCPCECPECSATETSVYTLISKWHQWRQTPGNTPHHDNGHLFSGLDFTASVIGFAGLSVMCASGSGGVDEVGANPTTFDAAVVAHELGHNWGFHHDDPAKNGCAESGFIMNSRIGKAPEVFSSCSHTYYATFLSARNPQCLSNIPTSIWGEKPVCGNNFLEAGEECDCGNKDSCEGTDNPCCDKGCKLKPQATCSAVDACCDKTTCKIITDTTKVCRSAINDCDLAETCNGKNSTCGADFKKAVGSTCQDKFLGTGSCYAGYCVSHQEQCRKVASIYNKCTDSFQLKMNNNNFCDKLWCEQPSGGCTPFSRDTIPILMEDGTRCGEGRVCKSNVCVAAADLSPFRWRYGAWAGCSNCTENQNRDIWCVTVDATTKSETRLPTTTSCPTSSKPASSRLCQNATAGCLGAPVKGAEPDKLTLAGVDVRSNAVIFIALAIFTMVMGTLGLCYHCLTHGSNEHNRQKKAAMLEYTDD